MTDSGAGEATATNGARRPGFSSAELEITTAQAASLVMVTPEWIRRLAKDGWIAKAERGRFRLPDVVQGYIKFLKDEGRRSSKTASHARLQEIKTRKEELAVARAERELIPLVDAMTLVDEIAGTVVARVNAIPARMTRNPEERAKLQQEIDEALAEVADRVQKLGTAARAGCDDPPADEEEAD
jgi:hypothetical protein